MKENSMINHSEDKSFLTMEVSLKDTDIFMEAIEIIARLGRKINNDVCNECREENCDDSIVSTCQGWNARRFLVKHGLIEQYDFRGRGGRKSIESCRSRPCCLTSYEFSGNCHGGYQFVKGV